jgi:hypothetical protein
LTAVLKGRETFGKILYTLRLRRRLYHFFLPPIERKREIGISHFANPHVCAISKFLESPAKSPFKRLVLETPLYRHLLLTMSSTTTSELNDADCEKGHVSQRPPISYATSKDEASMKASRETIKMKTSEGEVKVAVLGDSPGPEEYLQHISSFVRMLDRKKESDDMVKLAKAVARLKPPVRGLTTASCNGIALCLICTPRTPGRI